MSVNFSIEYYQVPVFLFVFFAGSFISRIEGCVRKELTAEQNFPEITFTFLFNPKQNEHIIGEKTKDPFFHLCLIRVMTVSLMI